MAPKKTAEQPPVEEAKEEKKAGKKPTIFKVVNESLDVVREYSVERHGKEAEQLAKEFVEKRSSVHGEILTIKSV